MSKVSVYVLINSDNTVNYVSDNVKDKVFEGVDVHIVYGKTISEVINGVDPVEAVWDEENEVCQNINTHPHLYSDGVTMTKELILDKIAIVDKYVSNPLKFELLTPEELDELRLYRNKLLDMKGKSNHPAPIAWPIVPDILTKE